MTGLVVDLFAGGGGASTGIEAALGRPVDLAVNHSAVAIAVHEANHKGTRHLTSDVYEVDPIQATRGQPIDLLWASPDCTHFSRAKGSRPDRPRSRKIRALAWVIVRWARAVRPRVILMENVVEFLTWGPLDKQGQPVARRAGRTFREWCRQLERLGYVVEWKELDASRYGAPTRRKRLFIVARCDGQPVRWPAPTHGPGLQPYRTAGECIDWSIPTRSIFPCTCLPQERKRRASTCRKCGGRRKPLAEKTLHRIAEGIRRFVIENPRPYIVRMAHGESAPGGSQRWGRGEHDGAEPLPTVTGSSGGGGFAVAVPHLVKWRHDSAGASLGEPAPTITGGGHGPGRPAGAAHALGLAVSYLVNTRNGEREGQTPRVRSLEDPAPTVTGTGSQGAVAEVALVDMQRENAPRGLDEPLGVVTTQGNRWNLMRAAFVARHFGGMVGDPADKPLATVTARDHHGPVAAALVQFRGECNGASLDEPMPAITAQGMHLAECRAFLTKWYSARGTKGASLFDGMPTATAKARFGLVLVDGVEYEIADIYLRMLEPEELLRAQFGEHADGYDLSPARTKEAKTRLIGNSVCPDVAAALVRSNVVGTALSEAAS